MELTIEQALQNLKMIAQVHFRGTASEHAAIAASVKLIEEKLFPKVEASGPTLVAAE